MNRNLSDLLFHVKPEIERNLVVPAAGRVQLSARGADSFRKRGFDIHVHVFKRLVPFELAGLDLLFDRAQSALDFLSLIDCYDLCLGECRGVRNRSRDIVSIQPPIE